MPDPETSPPLQAKDQAQRYPIRATPATPSLRRILVETIHESGPLPFPEFMAMALYYPDLGYYAREPRQVGRSGDFFTSVSVGPLFGTLLARRFLKEWRDLGSPARWRIVECGAHDGALAADVLGTIQELDSDAFGALEYAICEPLPRLRDSQAARLAMFEEKFRAVDSTEPLETNPLPGVVFGNELLDALPFHVVEWHEGWRECHVACDSDGNFIWQLTASIHDPALTAALAPLGSDFPDGYRTEVRTGFRNFLEPLTRCLCSGLMLWPDYGFARPDYYHPDRREGTLRTFSKHRAAADPLATPGEIDITAHVDFTALAECALTLDLQPTRFRNQGAWLTEIGREWLISQEGNPQADLLRQFQTLTHPAQLGACFQVLELTWNRPDAHLDEIDSRRLALCACPGPAAR